MNPDRAIGFILALSVGAVLILGTWLLWRAHQLPAPTLPPTPLLASDTETSATVAAATPSPVAAAAASPARGSGFRLAGTVTGDLAYAIIVSPNGEHRLVQPGQDVPGLGRLVAVGADSARIAGDEGELELRVAAAPSPTAAPTSATPPIPRITPVASPPPPARSESGSSP